MGVAGPNLSEGVYCVQYVGANVLAQQIVQTGTVTWEAAVDQDL